MPVIFLGTQETVREQDSCFHGTYILEGKTKKRQIIKKYFSQGDKTYNENKTE